MQLSNNHAINNTFYNSVSYATAFKLHVNNFDKIKNLTLSDYIYNNLFLMKFLLNLFALTLTNYFRMKNVKIPDKLLFQSLFLQLYKNNHHYVCRWGYFIFSVFQLQT